MLTCVSAVAATQPGLVDVRRVWSGAKHNAFGDLIRFQGTWFAVCREAPAHVPQDPGHDDDGRIRVITSNDGLSWTSAALVTEDGIDLRDPHLSVTPEGMLMLVMGGSIYEGKELKDKQPRVSFSKDGRTWSAPVKVLEPGTWLWRVTWFNGRAYGVSYGKSTGLYASDDGVKYTQVAKFDIPGSNETTLRFLADGRMVALLRRDYVAETNALIGVSAPPYTDWTWKDSGHRVGGPNFLPFADGSMWASGRDYKGATRTALARMTLDSYTPVLSLPSSGDSSYPGMVWHDGMLWILYYASHEEGTNLYMARLRLPK